jgi:hypothetical protein
MAEAEKTEVEVLKAENPMTEVMADMAVDPRLLSHMRELTYLAMRSVKFSS